MLVVYFEGTGENLLQSGESTTGGKLPFFFKGKKNMLSPELQLEKKQNPREAHNHNSQAQGWLKTED